MSDVIDQAAALQELNLTISLKQRKPELTPCGTCHWCSAHVQKEARYCDTDCRDDHAQHMRLNGGW